jgi:hypothetical protein
MAVPPWVNSAKIVKNQGKKFKLGRHSAHKKLGA